MRRPGEVVSIALRIGFQTRGGGCTYIGEVSNATTDEEDLALRVDWASEHEVEHSASIVVCLRLCWSTTVFSVVG